MKSRRILLINPGYMEYGDYGYSYMPPMGLLKIGGYMKNRGHSPSYIDCSIPIRMRIGTLNLKEFYKNAPFVRWVKCGNYENEGILKSLKYYGMPYDTIREKVRAVNPTEIWMSTSLTYFWETAKDIGTICKDLFPKVPLLVGGIHASLFPDHCQTHIPCDYVHKGPMDDLANQMPDYSLDTQLKSVRTIQLGDGCNVSPPCSFCAVTSMSPKFIPLDAQMAFNYIQKENKIGANFFQIWSSQLLVPQSRIIKLLDMIIKSGIKIGLVASEGIQPNLFTQDISNKMLKSGFIAVSIPMESIDPHQVKNFRKPSDFSDYEEAVLNAQRSGFKMIKSFVMCGIPGQTYDEMIHSIIDCWARDTYPAVHQYTPIPGSEDWSKFKQFHDISPDLLHPSLWPGASNTMKVQDLEEIKRITRMGFFNFMCLVQKSDFKPRNRLIWDIFVKWCKEYRLINSRGKPTYKRPLSYSGYTSALTDSITESICQS
jgi:hypothetical protein